MKFPKSRTFRSRKFLDFVRSLECFCCGAPPPSEASHYGGKGKSGGMGLKADDLFTAPMCRACHQHWHDSGRLPIPGGARIMASSSVGTFDPVTSRGLHIEANRDTLARYIRERLK